MLRHRHHAYWGIGVLGWIGASLASAAPPGTAFTYQGQLKQSGSPVNGNVNMTFRLFDSLTLGTQQGPTLTFDGAGGNPAPVSVTNGLFTVSLDFGVNPYTANQARWLDITVNGQPLSPRQPLSPAPFALNTRGLFVDASGNVGIGTAAPLAPLAIQNNSATSTTIDLYAPSKGSSLSHVHYGATGDWYTRSASASGKVVLQDGGGNVGVGTASPTYRLDVPFGTIRGGSISASEGIRGEAGGSAGIALHGIGYDFLSFGSGRGVVGESYSNVGVYGESTNSFGVYGRTYSTTLNVAGVLGEALGAGQVVGVYGIATTGTTAAGVVGVGATGGYFVSNGLGANTALWANGLCKVGTLQILGGSDLAEPFDVAGDDIKPGMVVVIDLANPGKLIACDRPYDRKVAGIISGAGGVATGVSMGHEGTIASGKHPVALSGRVYCLADATGAAIAPGDFLTTSSVVGHAMKAVDLERARGAIIGKAMTGLRLGERGLVLVLVNLQ